MHRWPPPHGRHGPHHGGPPPGAGYQGDPRHAVLEQIIQDYQHPHRVREEVRAAFQLYRYLDPMQASDGMLELEGTVPVPFQGNTYNYPVTIRVPANYPHNGCLSFISQKQLDAANMILSPSNRWVRPDGVIQSDVTTPVTGVIKRVVGYFSESPPVYAKPAGQQQQQPPQQQQQRPPATNPNYAAQKQAGYPVAGVNPSTAPVANPYVSGGVAPPKSPPVRNDDDWQAELLKSLRMEVRKELTSLSRDEREKTQGEVESLGMEADRLAKEVQTLDAEIASMRVQTESLQQQEQLSVQKVAEAKEWLAHNEGALSKKPEDMLPTTELDAQIIELTAEANALDDMLHLVGRCGEDPEKIVRLSMDLGRKRFDAVTLLNKAMEKKKSLASA
eukprot:TRINITY_DN355_c0_g3_i1.p1 TRINITY_DN355_c0_g3~~TRINITY_DN355_c0_g3_i1.p1  ORF type:complete len:408 (+),score=164.61 TRINITY_DN355_c0_g3_i1:59-1225(+)